MKEKGVLKMSRELNYPIKYAVLELKEKGGYLVGYKGITQGFIVSKCYVIRSNRAYNSDGSKIFRSLKNPLEMVLKILEIIAYILMMGTMIPI